MLYFAYGSNMSSRRLLARTPTARFISVATLSHHDLRFHKRSRDGSSKCDAYHTDDTTHTIFGVVFEIAAHEKPVLDRHEGLGRGYEKKVVSIDIGTELVEAYTYYANDIDRSLAPYHWYHHHVLSGAIEHGLPDDYIQRIRNIMCKHDPDSRRQLLEMAIYDALHTR